MALWCMGLMGHEWVGGDVMRALGVCVMAVAGLVFGFGVERKIDTHLALLLCNCSLHCTFRCFVELTIPTASTSSLSEAFTRITTHHIIISKSQNLHIQLRLKPITLLTLRTNHISKHQIDTSQHQNQHGLKPYPSSASRTSLLKGRRRECGYVLWRKQMITPPWM